MPFNKDQFNNPIWASTPPCGSRIDILSPNWCDKTTWYDSSVQVVDEVYTDSGDQLTYNPATSREYVDVMHGKITGERTLRATHAPVVKVDDVEQTENSPGLTDNDYTVDYSNGNVTFNAAQGGSAVIKVTYSYVVDSVFKVKPTAGKMLRITQTEVQFSEDIAINDTVLFQAYGLVEVFAPHLTPTPYPAGTKIPLGDPTVYQTMMDFINEASLSYPAIPALGGAGWRATSQPVHVFRWPYAERGTLDLEDSKGMEIRISLENNTSFGGATAVATLYGVSQDET
jgi:hypothetical protein